MIRDPSDGSVREKSDLLNSRATAAQPATCQESLQVQSALAPPPKEAKEAAKLIESRKWLADYQAGKVIRSPEQGEG